MEFAVNHIPGIVIAGTHSGSGKTTITIGILAALKKKGLNVQAFKVGPDFIDPGFHRLITGRPSRNLDIWMCGKDYVMGCYKRHSSNVDISIIEGVMGLYDGGETSTAELAKTLGLPIILIVDAHGMAESVGAIVKGYVEFDRGTNIAGVLFNRVSGERHFKMLVDAVKQSAEHRTQILGYLPRNTSFKIPERHLGLVVAEEDPISHENLDRLAEAVLRCIDIDMIVELTAKTTVLSFPLVGNLSCADKEGLRTSRNDNKTKIAVAYDNAFCFYYEDNLDLLKEAGAEIVQFSPLKDKSIPDGIHGLYLGGGYPELYAEPLSKNTSMLQSIYDWAKGGGPIYAECGGFMYLTKGIYDFEGRFYPMVGLFPFKTGMKKDRVNLGYRTIELKEDCILGKEGNFLGGHEFHYSEITGHTDGVKKIYSVKNRAGESFEEGYILNKTLAGYMHIHFGSNRDVALNFAKFCMES